MTKHFETLLRAYNVLENVTPLKYDCGKLCGSLCCRNNAENGETLGMWLLPYERELLETICSGDSKTKYTFATAEDGTPTVSCNGKCRRQYRPFACRIYPFYAQIDVAENKIRVLKDPRAALSCPIAKINSHIRPTVEFIACVKKAVRELMKDVEIANDIISVSDFLSEIREMQNKIFG